MIITRKRRTIAEQSALVVIATSGRFGTTFLAFFVGSSRQNVESEAAARASRCASFTQRSDPSQKSYEILPGDFNSPWGVMKIRPLAFFAVEAQCSSGCETYLAS